jgi:type I restriction enzyme S subunit
MTGRLSSPKPTDEPIGNVLRHIEQNHANSQGKMHQPISDEEIDFNLPSHWSLVRFGAIADHNAGKTLDKGRNSGQLRDYITTSNLYWGRFQLDELRQMPIREEELERCTARKGDLLICEGGEAGRAAVWPYDHEVSFQNHVHRARPLGGINPYFLYRYFEKLNATGEIAKFRKGVGISNMSGKALASIPIPLPPLAEQKRIVAKVDALMAQCDRLEEQLRERDTRQAELARAALARFAEAPTPANLSLLFDPLPHSKFNIQNSTFITPADLRKTILTLAVQGKLVPQDPNDEPAEELIARIAQQRRAKKAKDYSPVDSAAVPFEAPYSWSWVRLGNLALSSDSGWSPQCGSESRSGNEWGVLKVSAVSWGGFDPEANKALPSGMAPRPECEVRPGDFLLSRANTEELVARSVVVEHTPPRLMMSDKIVRFTFPDDIVKAFINLANLSEPSREYYIRNASGTSSSMKNIGREVMCNLPIALPPLAEQRRIVAKVDQLMALLDEWEARLTATRTTATHLRDALVAELTAV